MQGRRHKIQFTVQPASAGLNGFNFVDAVIYERGTGSFEWRSELTGILILLYLILFYFTLFYLILYFIIGSVDVEYVHRLTGAQKQEVEIGGKKAEYCIIP